MGKLSVFVINGAPMSGKDTFVKMLQKEFPGQVVNHSTVDSIKELYSLTGWNGRKDAHSRKVLSDMKDYLTKKFDLPFLEVQNKIGEVLKMADETGKDMMLFLHVREPEEIARIVKAFPETVTVQVTRQSTAMKDTSNHADANVNDYKYDLTIDNDGTIDELRQKALCFAKHYGFEKPKTMTMEFQVPSGMDEKEFEKILELCASAVNTKHSNDYNHDPVISPIVNGIMECIFSSDFPDLK